MSSESSAAAEIVLPLQMFGNNQWVVHLLDRDGFQVEILAQYISSEDESYYSEEHMLALKSAIHELLLANKLLPWTAYVIAEFDNEFQQLDLFDDKDFQLNYSLLPFRKWFIISITARHEAHPLPVSSVLH